jgi:hypothetical protein
MVVVMFGLLVSLVFGFGGYEREKQHLPRRNFPIHYSPSQKVEKKAFSSIVDIFIR